MAKGTMGNIVKVKGKDYLKIKDKLVEIDHFDENGKPVIGVWSEEKPNATGGMDCTVHVNCLQIAAETVEPYDPDKRKDK